MITRRGFLRGLAAFVGSGTLFAGYAFGVEPMLRLRITRYAPKLPGWPDKLALRIAILADIHAGEPQMSAARIRRIAERTNALAPDVVLLLGDYVGGHKYRTRSVPASEWAEALRVLSAPLGVHAVLGNHDWWHDRDAQRAGAGPVVSRREMERVGIAVYENDAVRLTKDGTAFWLAGLGDQLAFPPYQWLGRTGWRGVDDLPGTLAKITDDAPVILMAHEPDIFPQVPARVALTLSGHTHGGQVRILGYSPVVPSRFGNRYAYGHVIERDGAGVAAPEKHLIVSGGLGCSIAPIRFGVPPEIVVVDLGRSAPST